MHCWVISGVVDPRTGEEVSMQQAVLLGIINSEQGMYVDRRHRTSIPIPEAMNQGLIKVEFTQTSKTKEKHSDVGLLTIKTQRESRPYSVTGVLNAKSGDILTVDEAIRDGILDQKKGSVRDTSNDVELGLSEALDQGFLQVEYDDDAPEHTTELVTKTYAIHSVVDQRSHEKVPFAQAVREGLLDRHTGAYFHHGTNEHVFVGEAIRKGFIKAHVVEDPSAIEDISPENKLVVEKVNLIRKKLMNPLKTLAAFKYAKENPLKQHKQTTVLSHESLGESSGYSSLTSSTVISPDQSEATATSVRVEETEESTA